MDHLMTQAYSLSRHRRVLWLVTGVLAWWLAVFGLVISMAATPAKVARTADSAFVPGGTAHIYAPPIGTWPILVDRAAYDEYYRAFEAGDKGGVTEVLSRSEWIAVADRDAVLIIDVDGDAVQVELLDGRSAGGRGWLQMRHLHP